MFTQAYSTHLKSAFLTPERYTDSQKYTMFDGVIKSTNHIHYFEQTVDGECKFVLFKIGETTHLLFYMLYTGPILYRFSKTPSGKITVTRNGRAYCQLFPVEEQHI